MGKYFWELEQSRVPNEQLMAYIIAKVKPIEWIRLPVYHPDNLLWEPPALHWRFAGDAANEYDSLGKCIQAYNSPTRWEMHSTYLPTICKTNYTLLPKKAIQLREILKDHNQWPDIMKKHCPGLCEQAVEDIPNLCRHIEECLGLSGVKPYPMVRPSKSK